MLTEGIIIKGFYRAVYILVMLNAGSFNSICMCSGFEVNNIYGIGYFRFPNPSEPRQSNAFKESLQLISIVPGFILFLINFDNVSFVY